jgi:hypothetical protein
MFVGQEGFVYSPNAAYEAASSLPCFVSHS